MTDLIFPSISSILCITSIGAIFGLILSVAKIKLKVEVDPRYEEILEILPGANCGACSYPGCSGYAMKIVEEGLAISLCPVCDDEAKCKIGDIMGIEAESTKPRVAAVHCQGDYDSTKMAFIYDGPKSCAAAMMINDGFKVCSYGCLNLGDCEAACPFDAIYISDKGLPVVNRDKCTGCGKCVDTCPRSIISLIDEDFDAYVMCKNEQKAKAMKLGCSVGCIGCKKCVKTCKEVFKDNPDIETAIDVNNFNASIDYNLCTNCGKCAEDCPQNVISFEKQLVEA